MREADDFLALPLTARRDYGPQEALAIAEPKDVVKIFIAR